MSASWGSSCSRKGGTRMLVAPAAREDSPLESRVISASQSRATGTSIICDLTPTYSASGTRWEPLSVSVCGRGSSASCLRPPSLPQGLGHPIVAVEPI